MFKLLFALTAIVAFPSLASAQPPAIELRYAWVFDQWCSAQNKIEISESSRTALNAKFETFQQFWDADGPILLKSVEQVTSLEFKQKEMIASLFLCKQTPSMSLPLLINANWFVRINPYPDHMLPTVILHELIHTFLVDNFTDLSSTPLLDKYRSEDTGVLAHLHLMAIEAAVYTKLGQPERLKEVIVMESDGYSGAYKRAWEIVNSEGHQKFIDELLDSKKQKQ
jgi:hypothetical protein